EFAVADRVAVEVHAGCGRCLRCREGMYTSCLNYGFHSRGHRANGFTTDGGFAEYAINHVNTMVHIPDHVSDEEATLIVTAGTAMYGLDAMGGLVAGESVVVTGPGPIGLMGVGVAKSLGATPVILTGTRERRLQIGRRLGADHIVNVTEEDPVEAIARITGGKGVQYVLECSGAPAALDQSARMVNRGGRICLAAFPHDDDFCGPDAPGNLIRLCGNPCDLLLGVPVLVVPDHSRALLRRDSGWQELWRALCNRQGNKPKFGLRPEKKRRNVKLS